MKKPSGWETAPIYHYKTISRAEIAAHEAAHWTPIERWSEDLYMVRKIDLKTLQRWQNEIENYLRALYPHVTEREALDRIAADIRALRFKIEEDAPV